MFAKETASDNSWDLNRTESLMRNSSLAEKETGMWKTLIKGQGQVTAAVVEYRRRCRGTNFGAANRQLQYVLHCSLCEDLWGPKYEW